MAGSKHSGDDTEQEVTADCQLSSSEPEQEAKILASESEKEVCKSLNRVSSGSELEQDVDTPASESEKEVIKSLSRRNKKVALTRGIESFTRPYKRANLTRGQVRAARHKICFCATFIDVLATAFWLGRQPQTFWLNYAIKMVFLLVARLLCWKPLRQHYYMFDFCYFANCVTLSYVFIGPQNAFLFNAASGFCGMMLLSSQLFRDSYVPHSIDFFTTLQLHVLPALTMWTIRWYDYIHDSAWQEHNKRWAPYVLSPPKEISIEPSVHLYLSWFICYSLYMFVFARKRIERNHYANLYQYVMETGLGLKGKVVHVFPLVNVYPFGEMAFMCGHLLLFVCGLVYAKCGFVLQSLVLAATMVRGIYNGSTYYIDHFWKCHEANAAWYLEDSKLPSMQRYRRDGVGDGNLGIPCSPISNPQEEEEDTSCGKEWKQSVFELFLE